MARTGKVDGVTGVIGTPPIVTRGLGTEPRMVSSGFTPLIFTAIQSLIRKGRSAKKYIADRFESYSISAVLMSVNGKYSGKERKGIDEGIVEHDKEILVRTSNLDVTRVHKPPRNIFINALKVVKGRKK